jgi:hypothetical protein
MHEYPENRPTIFVHIRDHGMPIVSASEGLAIPSEQLPAYHEGMIDPWLKELRAMFSGCTIIDVNPQRFRIVPCES